MNRSLLVAVAVLLAGVALAAGYARFSPASAVVAGPPSASAGPAAPSVVSAPSAATTVEQQRLEERRLLYQTVYSLLSEHHFERARRLLDEDHARYGEGSAPEWRDLETSYRLIADCLEQPQSAKARLRAQAFVQVTEARGLVPRILTACESDR